MLYDTISNRAEQIKRTRFVGLDILKTICAFLVICIHCPFEGEFGAYFISLARIGVPIFLMITGFFYPKIIKENKTKVQVIKILKLVLISNFIFFLWNIFKCLIFNESLTLYFEETFTIKNFLKWIIFNESPFASHLWYLNAILYVLLFGMLIRKFINNNSKIKSILYISTPCLLLIDLALGKYSVILWGGNFHICW